MKSLYEQLGGTYHEGEDGLLYPDLLPPEEDAPSYGKYGHMRRTYLKEHRSTPLRQAERHLDEIDEAAHTRMELLTKQMSTSHGITGGLKASDKMARVGHEEHQGCSGRNRAV